MCFLTFSNIDIEFAGKKLLKRTDITSEVLRTVRRVKFINKKNFVKKILVEDVETFIVYMISWNLKWIMIDSSRKPQIDLLSTKEGIMLTKHANFAYLVLKQFVNLLSERKKIHEHVIKLVDSKQPPFKPIYSLNLVKLKILNSYIKTNLVNKFIQPSNSFTQALILFLWKAHSSLCLYIEYWGQNNVTMKNRQLLP